MRAGKLSIVAELPIACDRMNISLPNPARRAFVKLSCADFYFLHEPQKIADVSIE
jgi:hypothetical protein